MTGDFESFSGTATKGCIPHAWPSQIMSSAPSAISGSVINDEWGRAGLANRVPSDFREWFARFASDPNGAAMTPRAWQRIAGLPAILEE